MAGGTGPQSSADHRIIRSLRLLAGDAAANGFKRHIAGEMGDPPTGIPAKTLRICEEA